MYCCWVCLCFFFSSRRRHTRCALVTGVQTCALPISGSSGRRCWAERGEMMTLLPDLHAASATLIALIMFYGFMNGRLRVEIVSLLTIGVIALLLYVFPMPGQDKYAGLQLAFEGLGHSAQIGRAHV